MTAQDIFPHWSSNIHVCSTAWTRIDHHILFCSLLCVTFTFLVCRPIAVDMVRTTEITAVDAILLSLPRLLVSRPPAIFTQRSRPYRNARSNKRSSAFDSRSNPSYLSGALLSMYLTFCRAHAVAVGDGAEAHPTELRTGMPNAWLLHIHMVCKPQVSLHILLIEHSIIATAKSSLGPLKSSDSLVTDQHSKPEVHSRCNRYVRSPPPRYGPDLSSSLPEHLTIRGVYPTLW